MTYRVDIGDPARKALDRLPGQFRDRVFRAITALSHVPRPRGARKLVGEENLYRLRVAHYRIVYQIDDLAKMVLVTTIRHRKDVYRR